MVRIGMVNYINTAPIYEIWKEQVHRPDWQVTEAPPSTLNRMLAADELDLGFVSSYEYAVRPEKYKILADLSISATGPVGSVYLFSTVAPELLDEKLILVTGQSDTSVCLLRIILEEFLALRPRYLTGDVFGPVSSDEKPAAVLAIGDEALRLKYDNMYPVQLDLAEVWNRETGLPFVFAVCAAREECIARDASVVRKIREMFIDCRTKGMQHLPEICEQVARRIPMDCEACSLYLRAMEYDLGPDKQEALERFFTLLIRRGEADKMAVPLKIFI